MRIFFKAGGPKTFSLCDLHLLTFTLLQIKTKKIKNG